MPEILETRVARHRVDLVVNGLHKAYGGNEVLRGVDLHCRAGSVHALLGANGAGKSTLIGCIGGATSPDAGSIGLDGQTYAALTPQAARDVGIAIIHQHLSLVGSLSVVDNIFLGKEVRRGPRVDRRAQEAKATRLLDGLLGAGHQLSVRAPVDSLPVATRQIVEIAKATVDEDIRVLILDEPTASLSTREIVRLKQVVLEIASRGVCVLFITHLLGDVFDIADEITVLRDGMVTMSAQRSEVTLTRLTEAITGRAADSRPNVGGRSTGDAPPLIEVEGLSGERFANVSLTARPGEVVGIFGLVGSGRSELLETIAGVRRRTSGRVAVNGLAVASRSPREAMRAGIGLVPGDRAEQGIFARLSARDTMLLPAFTQIARLGRRLRRREREVFVASARAIGLRPVDPSLEAGLFSGGNQQKLVLARWLTAYEGVRVLLLDEPTQGVDIGARAEIYRLLRSELLVERSAVFTTADPDEVRLLADRVLVLDRGCVVADLDVASLDVSHMLELAHGRPTQIAAP